MLNKIITGKTNDHCYSQDSNTQTPKRKKQKGKVREVQTSEPSGKKESKLPGSPTETKIKSTSLNARDISLLTLIEKEKKNARKGSVKEEVVDLFKNLIEKKDVESSRKMLEELVGYPFSFYGRKKIFSHYKELNDPCAILNKALSDQLIESTDYRPEDLAAQFLLLEVYKTLVSKRVISKNKTIKDILNTKIKFRTAIPSVIKKEIQGMTVEFYPRAYGWEDQTTKTTAAHVASAFRDKKFLNYLIKHGADFTNLRDEKDQSALKVATKLGHVGVMKLILDNKKDFFPKKKVDVKESLKHIAISGNLGPKQKKDKMPLLHTAVESGKTESIRYLLQRKGTDVNITTKHGCTPLMLAASKGDFSTLKLLVEEGNPDLNKIGINGCTAIFYAVVTKIDNIKERNKIVRYLAARKNINLNYKNKLNGTILQLLMQGEGRHNKAIEILLKQKTLNINKGESLLDGVYTHSCENISIIKAKNTLNNETHKILETLKKETTTHLNQTNIESLSPKEQLVLLSSKLINELKEKKFEDLNFQNNFDNLSEKELKKLSKKSLSTYLNEEQIQCLNPKQIKYLLLLNYFKALRKLKHPMTLIAKKDYNDWRIISKSPKYQEQIKDLEILKKLKSLKDLMNHLNSLKSQDKKIKSREIQNQKQLEALRLLLSHPDININKRCSWSGETPLHVAAGEGDIEVVKLLLETKGIDLNCKTEKGKTPLDLAKQNKHSEIIELLEEKGGLSGEN